MSNYFKEKMEGRTPGEMVGMVILAGIGIVALIFLFAFVVMWLWNWLMPEIFGLPIITLWQGMGLCLLSKVLFGGFEGGGGSKNKSSSKPKNKLRCANDLKQREIAKWKMYDSFWKEEGSAAFDEYISNQKKASDEEE